MLLVASAVVTLFACSGAKSSSSELKALTVDEVAARIGANDGKTFVFDNNPKESWVNGHVPGAKWLDEDNVTAAGLPPDKSATLIFYCHNET